MDSIHLDGAETVSNAARTMRSAAEEMSSAAMTIDGALERQRAFMDDWLLRFEAIVDKLTAPPVISGPPEPVQECGDHKLGSNADKCFACFAHNESGDMG